MTARRRGGIRRAVDWWNDRFATAELVAALVAGMALVIYIYVFDGWRNVDDLLFQKRGTIYGALAALLGSLLGFVIAAVAIVIGEASRLTFVRDSGQLGNLFAVFGMSVRALGLGTVVAFVALVLDGGMLALPWMPPVVLFVVLLAAFRVGRAIWVINAVVRHVSRQAEDSY